jgi:hypothetical protein
VIIINIIVVVYVHAPMLVVVVFIYILSFPLLYHDYLIAAIISILEMYSVCITFQMHEVLAEFDNNLISSNKTPLK